MKDKLNNLISNLHMVLILLTAIPLFLNIKNQIWWALIPIGLIILIQCFQYASSYDIQESDHKDKVINNCCDVGKVILFTLYLIMTGYWIFSPLYYVVINPKNKKESTIATLMAVIGVVLVWLPRLKSVDGLLRLMLSLMLVLLLIIAFYGMEELARRIIRHEQLLEEHMTITALNELKVKNLNRELAMRYQLADTNARLEERENIARNIHNVVGHTITSAIVSLQAYRVLQKAEPEKAEDRLSAASERMRNALEEIRRAVRVLDQETLLISLKDFQRLLITELQRFSMDTDIEVSHNLNHLSLEQTIDKRYCEFLHSSLTECLNNGIRHGKATSFFVFLQCDTNHIELSVTDNGKGFDNLSNEEQERRIRQGYGIRKMEQFVLEHGGKMKLCSDNGFRIQLGLPLIRVK